MSVDARHSDTFAKTEAASEAATSSTPTTATPGVDNGAQAARAARIREHTFTPGGDDETAPPRPAVATPAPLANAIARVQMFERPSPFGVAQFPPLPIPPGIDSKR